MRLPLANRAVDVGIFRPVWGLQLWVASGVYCAVCKSPCTETGTSDKIVRACFYMGLLQLSDCACESGDFTKYLSTLNVKFTQK